MALAIVKQDVEDKHRQIEEDLQGWSTTSKRAKELIKYNEQRILKVAKPASYGYVQSWLINKNPNYSHTILEQGEKLYDFTVKSEILIDLGDEEITIPTHLFFLLNVVNKSRYLLDLEQGWDGDDGKPYSQQTWRSAVKFLVNFSKWAYDKTATIIQPPDIYHADQGSIDILWKTKSYRLLINIPQNGDIASFYGDNFKEDKIKGTFNINNSNQGLLLAITSM